MKNDSSIRIHALYITTDPSTQDYSNWRTYYNYVFIRKYSFLLYATVFFYYPLTYTCRSAKQQSMLYPHVNSNGASFVAKLARAWKPWKWKAFKSSGLERTVTTTEPSTAVVLCWSLPWNQWNTDHFNC